MKFKVGDVVKVVDNLITSRTDGHKFKLGTIATVSAVFSGDFPYALDGADECCLCEEEVELVANGKVQFEEQPLPVSSPNSVSVTDQFISELKKRQAKGIETYGKSLETFNGRDALYDAQEEAIDLSQYLFQARLERDYLNSMVADFKEVLLNVFNRVYEDGNTCNEDAVFNVLAKYGMADE